MLLTALLLPAATSAAAPAPLLSSADRASFRKLEARLGGAVGLAVAPAGRGGPVQHAGTLRTGVAWSTSKVPVAMAVIAAGGAAAHADDLRAAITASDNAAAERLWASLGPPGTAAAATDAQLRAAGDTRTRTESRRLRAGYTAFGQTAWALSDQVRFTAGLGCVEAGRAVLDLMGKVIPSERWGLGAVGHDARFKGGWGPGSDPGLGGGYLDRQLGTLTLRGRTVAVAIASRPADGSHAGGSRALTALARWVTGHVDVRALPATPPC